MLGSGRERSGEIDPSDTLAVGSDFRFAQKWNGSDTKFSCFKNAVFSVFSLSSNPRILSLLIDGEKLFRKKVIFGPKFSCFGTHFLSGGEKFLTQLNALDFF